MELDIVATLTQAGSTGLLGFMWWVARQDLAAALERERRLQADLAACHGARVADQKETIDLLTKETKP